MFKNTVTSGFKEIKDRITVLFLDNAPCHKKEKLDLKLKWVESVYLPKNTTCPPDEVDEDAIVEEIIEKRQKNIVFELSDESEEEAEPLPKLEDLKKWSLEIERYFQNSGNFHFANSSRSTSVSSKRMKSKIQNKLT